MQDLCFSVYDKQKNPENTKNVLCLLFFLNNTEVCIETRTPGIIQDGFGAHLHLLKR